MGLENWICMRERLKGCGSRYDDSGHVGENHLCQKEHSHGHSNPLMMPWILNDYSLLGERPLVVSIFPREDSAGVGVGT